MALKETLNLSGPELWNRAKEIIPGGNQLLSKRSERYLPGLWPAYYSKAKGCEVWDVEGKHYYDFAQMGVGSCILGYADEDVDTAVKSAIDNGSMCTLNCPEEIELAEKLIELHPWAGMVRFSRSGGEACSIAVRIARAFTGKDKVLFCGYHGWHDWYLSANLGETTNLDGHLLPGLAPKGVPRGLKGSAVPFDYNDPANLKELVRKYSGEIAAIIMEPVRNTCPEPGFLEEVRNTVAEVRAVLIFDEVTSGFRMNLGGIHLTLGVEPDLAIFGKAMGNGYPISAIIGKKKVMDAAQDTFVSSTFWTERIGFTAALKTIRKMEELNVQKNLVKYGEMIGKGWKDLGKKYKIDLEVTGIPPLVRLSFKVGNPLELQTLYSQGMLCKGYLLGSSVYTTYAYSDKLIEKFLSDSDEVFAVLREAVDSGNVKKYLKGEVMQPGFKRLT